MDHLFPVKMSLLSSKSLPEPQMMDSRTEEIPTNPNQGNPVACHGRSSQVIPEGIDLVSDLKGPPQDDEEFQRKIGMVSCVYGKEFGAVSIRESSQPKAQTWARRLLCQPLSGIEEFLEDRKKISASGNGIF
ncbi:hypothetical protein CsatB_005927 [Cannabis sativa]